MTYLSSKDYPTTLRRVVVKDDAGKRLVFLTNNFALKPELIADLYRQRWQVELFFKWIKQHLRIKVFFGLSLAMFETIPINQLLTPPSKNSDQDFEPNQLVLL